jgi:flagellar biosynthetic protein FliR
MLVDFLTGEIQGFLLIFVRVGAAFTVMPAFGEPFVPMRMRLTVALFVTLALTPMLAAGLPPPPESALGLLVLIAGESFIGFFLGIIARSIMSALQTAGMASAMMIGLANALTQDTTAVQQGSILGALLTMLGLLVVMALNLHHLMLAALADSYEVFVPGQAPIVEDVALMVARVVSSSFALGIQLAAPFIGLAVVFYVGLGLINRLMSSMQIFFIAIPMQIVIGLGIMSFALPVMLRWFAAALEEHLMMFLGS